MIAQGRLSTCWLWACSASASAWMAGLVRAKASPSEKASFPAEGVPRSRGHMPYCTVSSRA